MIKVFIIIITNSWGAQPQTKTAKTHNCLLKDTKFESSLEQEKKDRSIECLTMWKKINTQKK